LTEDGLFDLIRTKSGSPCSSEKLPEVSKKGIKKGEEVEHDDKMCFSDSTQEPRIETSKNIEKNVKKEESSLPGNCYTDIPF
jgi:hypothetical protein